MRHEWLEAAIAHTLFVAVVWFGALLIAWLMMELVT